jgi:hypothetical protein
MTDEKILFRFTALNELINKEPSGMISACHRGDWSLRVARSNPDRVYGGSCKKIA